MTPFVVAERIRVARRADHAIVVKFDTSNAVCAPYMGLDKEAPWWREMMGIRYQFFGSFGQNIVRALRGALVAAALLPGAFSVAMAQNVVVDVAPLAASSGGSVTAPRIDPAIRAAAREAMAAGRFGAVPPGGRLILQVDKVQLGFESTGFRGGGDTRNDYISGKAIIRDARGATLRSTGVIGYSTAYGGLVFEPHASELRFRRLAEIFVGWAERSTR